jgi:hypothetical protein
MVYSFFRSNIVSLFVVLATYSAREIISCSDKLFMTFVTNGLLTDIEPALAALECQFN